MKQSFMGYRISVDLERHITATPDIAETRRIIREAYYRLETLINEEYEEKILKMLTVE